MLNSRERVLNNLLSWNVLASGKIVRKTTMLELEKSELNGKCKELDEEYDFVNKNIDEIKQKFVEDIKQNPQD
jgi:hypothetical protein